MPQFLVQVQRVTRCLTQGRVVLVSARYRISIGFDTTVEVSRAELGERQVRFLLRHCMCVHAEREGRVSVTELVGDPPDALPRIER